MEQILIFIFGCCLAYYFIETFFVKRARLIEATKLESQFLMSGIAYEQLRHQMLAVLEIVYDKASESDPQFLKDYENIKKQLNTKFDEDMNLYVISLQKVIPYKTRYSNWKEATKYIEGLILINKYDNNEKANRKND